MVIKKNYKILEIKDQKLVHKSKWTIRFFWIIITVLVSLAIWKSDPNFDNSSNFSSLFKGFFDFSPVKIGAFNEFSIMDTISRAFSFLLDTLIYSLLGTILGVIISIPVSILSSKNIIKKWYIYTPLRWIFSIIRAIPPLVYATLLFFILSPTLAATTALTIFVAGIMVKWLYEELDTIDLSTYNSLISLGISKPRAVMKAIMPHLMNKVVSYGLYAFEMVVRFATILGLVGITTIGYLLDLYSKPEHWGHMFVVLCILIYVIVIIEIITTLIKRYVLEPRLKQAKIDKTQTLEKQIVQLNEQKPKSWIIKVSLILVIIGAIIYSLTKLEYAMANEIDFQNFKEGWKLLWKPDWSLITNFGTGENALELAWEVFYIAIVSTLIGMFFGLIFGIFASANITGIITAWFFKTIIIIIRTIPSFIYAIVFVLIIAHGSPFAATMALGIRSIGMLGKLTYEKIESTDMGGKLSMDVVGNTNFNATRIAIISEAIPAIISNALYRVEINFKSIVEVGAVGASAFGFQLLVYSGDPSSYNRLTPYLIVMIGFVLIIEQVSTIIRKKVMTGNFLDSSSYFKRKIRRIKKNYGALLALSFDQKLGKNSMIRSYDYRYIWSQLEEKHGMSLNEYKMKIKNGKIMLAKLKKNYTEMYYNEFSLNLNSLYSQLELELSKFNPSQKDSKLPIKYLKKLIRKTKKNKNKIINKQVEQAIYNNLS